MNDERLLATLRRLGAAELPVSADRATRSRLETAWARRRRARGSTWRVLGPALASLALVTGLGGAALGAGADSPLWDTRVALESAAAAFRTPDDRLAYLLELVRSRTEEAALQEAAGQAAAAARARASVAAALVQLDGAIPRVAAPEPLPTPAAAVADGSPSPRPTPSASIASPTARPAASPASVASERPAVGSPPTAPPPAEPVRTHSPTPALTVRPSATPAPARQIVYVTGIVRYADGTTVSGACITTSPVAGGSCIFLTKSGSYAFTSDLPQGQSITLYAWVTDPARGGLQGGLATATITAPTTLMPAITLTPKR